MNVYWPTRLQQCIKALAYIVLLVVFSFPLAAQTTAEGADTLPALEEVISNLSQESRNTLLQNGEIMLFRSEIGPPTLLPQSELSARIYRQITSNNLNMGSESLFFASTNDLPERYAFTEIDERNLKLYNILRSVSTLTGLEYYSASRKKMRLLFVESWVIANPDKPRKALPDPIVDNIPSHDRLFIHQRDKSFASNQSEMTFFSQSGTYSAAIVNVSNVLYKGLIKVVEKGNMQTHFLLVPVKEGLLIYTNMSAKTIKAPFFESRAKNSFTNRVIALSTWYKRRLTEEFSP